MTAQGIFGRLSSRLGGGGAALFLVVCSLIFVACQLALISVGAVESDEGFFAACAVRQIALHLAPLAGCVDTKPPGVFLLYEIAFRSFGLWQPLGLRLFAIGFGLTAAWALARLGAHYLDAASGTVAAALLLLLLPTSPFFLALKTELPATALVLLALVIVVRAVPTLASAAIAGALVGCATLFKQPMAVMLAPVALAGIIAAGSGVRRSIVGLLVVGLGFAAPLVLVAAAYWGSGQWEPFVQQMWVRPRLYALHKSAGFTLGEALARTGTQLAAVAIVVALLCAGAWRAGAGARITAGARMVFVVYCLCALVLIVLGTHFFPAYFIPLLPALAIALARPLAALDVRGPRDLWTMAGLATAAYLSVTNVVLLRQSEGEGAARRAAVDRIAAPSDAVYVWGYVPEFYPEFRRMPVSGFIASSMLFGYFHDSERYAPPLSGMRLVLPGDWARFLAELERGRPFLFVDTSAIRMGARGNYPPQAFPPMARFLRNRCKPRGDIGGFPAYRCV